MPEKKLPAIANRAVSRESNKRASWNKVGWRSRESTEGYRRKPRRYDVRRDVSEIQDRCRRSGKKKGKTSAKKQGKLGETLGGIRGNMFRS